MACSRAGPENEEKRSRKFVENDGKWCRRQETCFSPGLGMPARQTGQRGIQTRTAPDYSAGLEVSAAAVQVMNRICRMSLHPQKRIQSKKFGKPVTVTGVEGAVNRSCGISDRTGKKPVNARQKRGAGTIPPYFRKFLPTENALSICSPTRQ